jgi:hypothetical protein
MEPSLEPFGGVNGLLTDFLVFLVKIELIDSNDIEGLIGQYWEGFQ